MEVVEDFFSLFENLKSLFSLLAVLSQSAIPLVAFAIKSKRFSSFNLKWGLVAISVLVIFGFLMAGFLLRNTLADARSQTILYPQRGNKGHREGNTLILLVRRRQEENVTKYIALTDRVKIALYDIETLKGKMKEGESPTGHDFNKQLKDANHVFGEIFKRANVAKTVAEIMEMEQGDWDSMLKNEFKEVTRDQIKDIPFVRFEVVVDNTEIEELSERYFFRGETISIPLFRSAPLEFELVNVYNTKHKTSGEPEVVIIRYPPSDASTIP